MIKQAFAMSLGLISAQVIASTPCPTCKKGYVASSLEEVLIEKRRTEKIDLKNMSRSLLNSQVIAESANCQKSPVQILENRAKQINKDSRTESASDLLPSYAPKRDKVLADSNIAYRPLSSGRANVSGNLGNQSLRETFGANMALNTKVQLQQHLQKLRR